MVKQFLVWLVVLLAIMVALSLALGGFKLPLSAGPSPTGTPTVRSTPASQSPTPTPTPTATPEPTSSITPLPSPVQFTISGRGSGNSRQFDLPTLSYIVAYDLGGSCQYLGTLNSIDGTYSNPRMLSIQADPDSPLYPISGPTSGSRPVHLNLPGTYVVAMNTASGCAWSLTFLPQ